MCSLIAFVSLLIVASVSSNADPQYVYNSNYNNPFQNYGGIQNGFPQSSFETPQDDPFSQQAQFRALFTFTFATTTSTSTFTSYTTCTTSTKTLNTCSPSGRRRRGMILSGDRKGRGLFFNEKDQEKEDSNIFLPQPKKIEEPVPEEKKIVPRQSLTNVPFMIEPGFEAQTGDRLARGLIFAFATKTVTMSTTSTSTVQLTAFCKSTTGFNSC